MIFLIADTFQAALARLDNASQKAAKLCAFDLAQNPSGPGKQFHRIDRSKEKNFWSVRANRDIRIIVHKTADRFTLCYVDHHDDAYDWAERRVFETHPTTGALQIVELVERVEEIAPAPAQADLVEQAEAPAPPPAPLADVAEEDLLKHGIPPRWIAPLREASEARALDLAEHLPAEGAEAVLSLLAGDVPVIDGIGAGTSADEQRRFRVVEHVEELEKALNYPWDRWTVFLHPSQRRFVDTDYDGPARVAGSAGTGKTVVAVHRAIRMSREPGARVLLTTFSRPLAASLQRKVGILNGDADALVPSIQVASFIEAAAELWELNTGRKPHFVRPGWIEATLAEIAPNEDQAFLLSEWRDVIDAWQIETLDAYADISRTGRRSRVSKGQRERYWPIFAELRRRLGAKRLFTEAMVFGEAAAMFTDRPQKPFTHIIADEAQDLGVAELRFLKAISEDGRNALFFAGDLGQRIFKLPFSWKALGIDVRGRSGTLSVNYRTSHQLREAADRLLPTSLTDFDGVEERRGSTVSIFNGPEPVTCVLGSVEEEVEAVAVWVNDQVAAGLEPREIGLIVRDATLLERARQVCVACSLSAQTLTEAMNIGSASIAIGTMHLAKGLEFRAVAVLGCDDEFLPLRSRLENVATEADLDEVYATERHLLYVACTRAREHLHLSAVAPATEFFADLS